jgi:DNA-binding NtrC family response regulator
MVECAQPGARQILVTASAAIEAGLARAAVEELGLLPVLVQDIAEAVRLLCADPRQFAAVVAGERVGPASGLTLCAVARDAGVRVPMLLITGDNCRWTAARATRLQVTVLWQPVPARRIARTLLAMLPRRLSGVTAEINATRRATTRERHADRWRRARRLW